MRRGVILYGPPAAGKDTITSHLHALDPGYVLFPRLKSGRGRTTGYRMTTDEELDRLSRVGAIIWENTRYGGRYAIDHPELTERLGQHCPVLHLGQVSAIDAVRASTRGAHWLVVSVWCPRDEAARRISARATGDTDARLRAWDETEPLPQADLTFQTADTPAPLAAKVIDERLRHPRS